MLITGLVLTNRSATVIPHQCRALEGVPMFGVFPDRDYRGIELRFLHEA